MSAESIYATIAEARRQVEICNACRYCEGYCSVFPVMFRQRQFADGDLVQLANLCHNCRGCYYACQYTAPHEFDLNVPGVLAELRTASWERYAAPGWLARRVQRHGLPLVLALVAAIALLLLLIGGLDPTHVNGIDTGAGVDGIAAADDATGFYRWMSHMAMVALFLPAFLLPLWSIAIGLRRYWRDIGGAPIRLHELGAAMASAAALRNLSGGQGQGCNYESEDAFSNRRRWLHQATMWGFLLCFASTASATVMHYAFALPAPYPLFSLPKLLGVPGGVLLVIGCVGLAWLKPRGDASLGTASALGGERAFIALLGLTGASGLALYAASDSALVGLLLPLHLGTVLAFFLTMPYSKMVHGFYRLAALVREVQLRGASTR